jgi:2-oxoglutarate ferredoxin oxidoreductase subunit beta
MPDNTHIYDNEVENAWCPGCGNFGILEAVKSALSDLAIKPDRVVMCSGIGQGPKLPHYLNANVFDGLHGRELASATGIKLAADDLVVIVHAGDGGAYGEGGNHFISAIRRNIDITLIVHDNHVYGLTKGQASPTTQEGTSGKLQPRGLAIRPLNPLLLALSQGCGFVSQGYSGDKSQLSDIIKQAILYQGFSLVNVLQPCVTWDKVHTYSYYKDHCYVLADEYNPHEIDDAYKLLTKGTKENIPTGIIYQKETIPYEKTVLKGIDHPLRDRKINPAISIELLEKL